ncbi:hypothetical protein [Paenibacillus jiagnxiensis]|uniref:hypothetical protein n=1 Tax=Paenibacillus jiagnxiensis TaxID=3228926 RepID=UPI0033B3DD0F
MKFLASLMLAVSLLTLAACSNNDGATPAGETNSGQNTENTQTQPGTEPNAENGQNGETDPGTESAGAEELTADSIKTAMQKEGITLTSSKAENDWVLNDTQPDRNTVKTKSGEEEVVTIYTFDSEEARQAGLANFKEQTESLPLKYLAFEHKNALILYYYNAEETTDPASTEYGAELDKTLKSL